MGKVVLDMTMSLDGFIWGSKDEDGGLHDWFFAASDSGSADAEVVAESIETTGAILIGRRTYDVGERLDGFAHTPYKVPHLVLSHYVPDRMAEGVTFTFVNDDIASAVEQARSVAGDGNVVVGGGADIARQALEAGLVEEAWIHLAPVLLGDGIRLFAPPGTRRTGLEIAGLVESPHATHLKFRIVKDRDHA